MQRHFSRYNARTLSEGYCTMSICHEHNLAQPTTIPTRFGIRVKLRATDPFRKLVGDQWQKEHWFGSANERDEAMTSMSGRYPYFRPGDQPALVFEKIEKN